MHRRFAMLVGYPEAQENFKNDFPRFIDEIELLGPILQSVFIRTETAKTTFESRQIFFLGGAVYQDFQEILLLVGNGLSVGGLKILRGLYEKVVTAAYIARNPPAARDFADYTAIHEHKLLNRIPPEVQSKIMSESAIQRIKTRFSLVKERFTKKVCDCGKTGIQSSWTALDMYSLALKIDNELPSLYGPAYMLPTLHLHTTAFDLKARAEESTDEVSMYGDASLHFRNEVLMPTHMLVLYMARLNNSYFGLGLNAEINEAVHRYNLCWAPHEP
jgi:hypothetical protein